MLDCLVEEFWWKHIAGPSIAVSNITLALLDNKNIVLQIPSDLPWKQVMRSIVDADYREKNSAAVVQFLDVAEDNPEGIEPGKLILQRFASPQVAQSYREKSAITIQNYIMQKGVLQNSVLWIKGVTSETASQWISFCKVYHSKNISDGLLILELCGQYSVPPMHHLKAISLFNYVSNYDLQLFNRVIVSDRKISDVWKNYISTVCALICGTDAEISTLLLDTVDFQKDDLILKVKEIAELEIYQKRGEEHKEYILNLARNNQINLIEHLIWEAQVQVLFPIIELERVTILYALRKVIQNILDTKPIQQYGVTLKDAIDVELGTLCYMMTQRTNDGSYLLYIPDENVRQRIHFLHTCRNLLAHASPCSPSQVKELLNNNKYMEN